MTATIKIKSELTPRQCELYKEAYQVLKYHASDIILFQTSDDWHGQYLISFILGAMKKGLCIANGKRYEVEINDLRMYKSMISECAGWFNVNDQGNQFLMWQACQASIALLELLQSEILYDDCDGDCNPEM